jgi:hypothetical protein
MLPAGVPGPRSLLAVLSEVAGIPGVSLFGHCNTPLVEGLTAARRCCNGENGSRLSSRLQ